MIDLIMEQRKDCWQFFARYNGVVIGDVTVKPEGDTAVIHNEVYHLTKNLIPVYREMFRDIRAILKKADMKLVMAVSDQYSKKTEKYWRLMGFECFGRYETINYAVMEA